MTSILYYSNQCAHSRKLLQHLSKTHVGKEMHFICIDKRTKPDQNGNIYVILENSQKIVLPKNVKKVPALLLLGDNGKVLYGDDIYTYIRPIEQQETKVATQNNMEPVAFMFGGGGSIVSSDTYSFLDMDAQELKAEGNGGLRQMHNYMAMDGAGYDPIQTPTDDNSLVKANKITDSDYETLQNQRAQEDSVYRKTNAGHV